MILLLLLLLYSFLFLDCSVEYISLKKLCHYGDPNVPEAIQKKAYGILAPLFSQKPWVSKWPQPGIEDGDWSILQAIVYALNLHVFPQELVFKIFNKGLFMMRQYKKFHSQASFIPFLYKNKVWSLQHENGYLKRYVGYEHHVLDIVKLSCPVGFNYVTNPLAVLKTRKEGIVACLFSNGFSLVDLNTMKEISFQILSDGHIKEAFITGYNDYVCFLDSNNDLNFYIVFSSMSEESPSYVIKNNQKFNMMNDENYNFLRCMNAKSLFYTFLKKKYVPYGPHSYWNFSSISQISNSLYCICFTETLKEEHIFYTLSEDKYFCHFACNDVCLIATDNHSNLYIWDLTKNGQPPQIISSNDNIIQSEFWLDDCLNRILTQKGVFKIENVFEGLPKIPVDIIKKSKLLKNETFFKKIFKHIVFSFLLMYKKFKDFVFLFLSS